MGICVSCRRRERKAPEKRWVPGAGGLAKGAAAELLPRRAPLPAPAMANSISNIKMTNPIKGIVSRRRKRYVQDGFNLDLAYITDRLIAMGYPGDKLEGVYRNHIDDVYRFLEQMHQGHYKIYNLCAERTYDSNKFHQRVVRIAIEDHAPPKITQIQEFCVNAHDWLNEDPRNVAAVHCKAGKGRTGTMVCCYLLYSGQQETADKALQFYGIKRTHDQKGVTIPSQRRYVDYYAALVRGGLAYRATRVHVRELLMSPPPALTGSQCTLEVTVTQPKESPEGRPEPPFKASLGSHELRREGGGGGGAARVVAAACTPLAGDVRVDVYCKPKMMMRKERLFHFWFNTFFVTACVGAEPVPAPVDSPNLETFKLTLDKWQLDDAHKDKQHKLYSPDFKVELIIQKQPESSTFSGHSVRASSSLSSCASSGSEPDTEPDAHWDSGERLYAPYAPYPYRCPFLYTSDYYPDPYTSRPDHFTDPYTSRPDHFTDPYTSKPDHYPDPYTSKPDHYPDPYTSKPDHYPDPYTSKPDHFPDPPEYPDDDKLYMNIDDSSLSANKICQAQRNLDDGKLYANVSDSTNTQYDNNLSTNRVLLPDNKSNDDKVYKNFRVDPNTLYDNGKIKATDSVEYDDNLFTKTQERLNEHELSKSDDSSQSINIDDELSSNTIQPNVNVARDESKSNNVNESSRDVSNKDNAKSRYNDDGLCAGGNTFPISNEYCTCKLVRLDKKTSFASHLKDGEINLHTDEFELPIDSKVFTDKPKYDNNLHRKIVENPINTYQKYPVHTDSCINNAKYPISNTHTNQVNCPANIMQQNEPKYSVNNDLLDPQSPITTNINKENPLCTKETEYLNAPEKPPEYPAESKKDSKTEEFSKKDKKCKYGPRSRLTLGDMRASWREFSGKFGENRKKKHKDDRQ